MYYIFVENNKLNGCGQAQCLNADIQNIEVSEEIYNAYTEDNLRYIWNGTEIIINPDYEQQARERETERVGELTMTALDFITFLRQCGLTLEQIRGYLNTNLELDTQLTYCQNVYCKVARAIMPLTVGDKTITPQMVEQAFKRKNGEE